MSASFVRPHLVKPRPLPLTGLIYLTLSVTVQDPAAKRPHRVG
jgi:hypothetical protein